MKDEIKEILDEFMNFDFNSQSERIEINEYERNILKDYITNLQEENDRLKAKYNNNKSHEINYKYFTILYSKATKDIVIDDLVYKCEDLDNLRQSYEKLYVEKEDYKSKIEKTIDNIDITIEIIKQQPTEDDTWILDRLNGFKYLLQGGGKDEYI